MGKWRLKETDVWPQTFIDLREPGYIELKPTGRGRMVFGTVKLALGWKAANEARLDFAFKGFNGPDEVSGEGWVTTGSKQILGELKSARGGSSGFVAEKWRGTRKGRNGRAGQ